MASQHCNGELAEDVREAIEQWYRLSSLGFLRALRAKFPGCDPRELLHAALDRFLDAAIAGRLPERVWQIPERLGGWLFRTACHVWQEECRRQVKSGVYDEGVFLGEEDGDGDPCGVSASVPLTVWTGYEEEPAGAGRSTWGSLPELWAAVAALPRLWQQILQLHYWQGWSFRHIGHVLGYSHVWILRCHRKALSVLRHSLSGGAKC